jgi:hypothetical protein
MSCARIFKRLLEMKLLRLRVSCACRPRKGVSFELHLHPARARRVYILSACLHSRCARRDTTPTFSSERASYFSFALILKVKFKQAALRNLLVATENVCTMESERDAFLAGKKALLLARALILHSLIQLQIGFRTRSSSLAFHHVYLSFCAAGGSRLLP